MMKSRFLMFAGMMAMASAQSTTGNYLENDEIVEKSKKPPKKIIPKGCKEYWFLPSGRFVNEKPNDTYESVYYCIASSDKSAIKKFNKNQP